MTLANCIALSLILFAIGTFGVIARRNLLIVLMSVELMLNAANLALVAFSRHFALGGRPFAAPEGLILAGSAEGGQVLTMISMAVAACEVAVGLALLIALFRTRGTVLSTDVADMRG